MTRRRNSRTTAASLAAEEGLAPLPDAEPVAAAPATAAPAERPRGRRPRGTAAAPRPERAAAAPAASKRNAVIAPMPVMAIPPALAHEEYRPDPRRHMSEMGAVATSNFICRIGGRRITVRMGAPRSAIPKEIQTLMAEAGVPFGHAMPAQKKGAVVVVEDEDDAENVPRARRTHRPEKNEPTRQFRKPLALPVE
jgi:hypothetical protein